MLRGNRIGNRSEGNEKSEIVVLDNFGAAGSSSCLN